MSKYSDQFTETMKDVCAIKRATRDAVGKGGKLAFKEYHDSRSLDRLKKKIREEK